MNKLVKFLILAISLSTALADKLITIFPLDKYDQDINNFIHPGPNYDRSLISQNMQEARLQDYLEHYYGGDDSKVSPWGKSFVMRELGDSNKKGVIKQQAALIKGFYANQETQNKRVFGENFRPYPFNWFQALANNMDLSDEALSYQAQDRAIAVNNLLLRALPTNDPVFYDYNIAGEGYPFDNLQETQILTGMPLYILKQSADKAWSLVIATDAVGWVPTNGIARVSPRFIKNWQKAAWQNILAITTNSSLLTSKSAYAGTMYAGASLPLLANMGNQYKVLVPVADGMGFAVSKEVFIAQTNGVKMPLALTPHNMAMMIQKQIATPYGWGNSYFYRDCSSETKTLFIPFAIYLPRNSSTQAEAGNTVVNLDKLSAKEREEYLLKHAHPLVTLVQVPGHILLYIGNYSNPFSKEHETIAMSYQNIWGLWPKGNSTRAIIGSSVLLPLLQTYPEGKDFVSIYDSKLRKGFRLIYLDE